MQKCKLFFFHTVLLLLTAFSINPAIAAFDPATELKVLAADGAAGDEFGFSVSIDGTRMAVGAYRDDSSQGAVYIYDLDGTNWNQTTKLTAADGAANDLFGYSISLSDNRLVVGAVGDDSFKGASYIFDLSGGSWTQTTKLTASDGAAYDLFGKSVSLSGNRLAVGADLANIGGGNQGVSYIFDLSGGSWIQTTKLIASDGAAGDRFGWSVSLSGNRLAVGAWQANIGSNSSQGAAYIFDFDGTNWNQTTKLTATDGAAYDDFGVSVSLSGDRLAVGAYYADVSGNSYQGAAYVFDLSGGSWSQTTKLTASDGAAEDRFGWSVSLSDNRLAVGAFGDEIVGNTNQGSAYIFDLSGGSWSQTTNLTATDGMAADRFGISVSLSDNRLAVGAYDADIGTKGDQGAAYVYTDDVIFKNGFEQE